MSNLKTYFKNVVSVCKKGFAYARAVSVLVKATYQRMVGNGIYNVSFIKIGRKWYCEVPGFPKELFEHTLMVGGASKLLDYHARGGKRIAMKVKITNEENGNMELVKNIFFNTDKLVENSKVKISYTGNLFQNASTDVSIHYGFGLNWENVNDIKEIVKKGTKSND